MVTMPSALRLVLLAALTGQTWSSRISFFTDDACGNFTYNVQGPNGYPDGDCSLLDSKGDFGSFKVVRLDRGCDVTLYGPNTTLGICSPGGSIVANVGRCYNESTWTYYSIDTCIRSEAESSTTTSSSASSSPVTSSSTSVIASPTSESAAPTGSSDTATNPTLSDSDDTGAIAGGVVGGVAGLALIVGGAWYFLRRRRRKRYAGPGAVGLGELSGQPMVETGGKEIQKPSELPEARVEAYVEPPPQELSAEGERGVGGGRGDNKPPI